MLVTKFSVSLSLAKQIAAKAEEEAIEKNLAVSIAVVNDAGQLVYFRKMDNCSNASCDIGVSGAAAVVDGRIAMAGAGSMAAITNDTANK